MAQKEQGVLQTRNLALTRASWCIWMYGKFLEIDNAFYLRFSRVYSGTTVEQPLIPNYQWPLFYL